MNVTRPLNYADAARLVDMADMRTVAPALRTRFPRAHVRRSWSDSWIITFATMEELEDFEAGLRR